MSFSINSNIHNYNRKIDFKRGQYRTTVGYKQMPATSKIPPHPVAQETLRDWYSNLHLSGTVHTYVPVSRCNRTFT